MLDGTSKYQEDGKWLSDVAYAKLKKMPQPKPHTMPNKETKLGQTIIKKAEKDLGQIVSEAGIIQHQLNLLKILSETQDKLIEVNKAELERRAQSLLEYGDHTEDCEWRELTGRVLNKEEKELCSCGWTEMRLELQKK